MTWQLISLRLLPNSGLGTPDSEGPGIRTTMKGGAHLHWTNAIKTQLVGNVIKMQIAFVLPLEKVNNCQRKLTGGNCSVEFVGVGGCGFAAVPKCFTKKSSVRDTRIVATLSGHHLGQLNGGVGNSGSKVLLFCSPRAPSSTVCRPT